ncbi:MULTISPECIES: 4-(cytidine 5'-diphospho)-2-C-methyl-D-erythritol kinase [Pseudoalteromonas]|uniref:4-diphosphocytidyl-2-C-methyl-D-erythritol kinase n=1 Tax=Pseudoalteromonas fuliginea TaxID=1872678 RepID=A0ABD3YBH4_9GAMM|nr:MULTISPECIES: 4-(cytidine 5'-diphospho)-2-C-methyl-D-erythritol kinase [Pseudoalteromonas]ALQ08703.1 4-(cytidine 5'-diphospho)-2-C-methyl-D-erythritol kinase [Pseudoalteromonas sp. Bsw20308]KAA1154313.1 4-(cytidine 5'-diphospho)-2-C-methyl-D-erythritol kinase [Pseudoalteromonas fuliginea]KAA1166913.1 4-(cytidine 5'-diphospho)-2-C-methyl-D-erythritol kinase [Pseudoalteromonas fuliginea]KDC51698.1 kinase [Pseudoalteromonas fuliginea]KDC52610.1 kinase [Pseudoalteromonas sp. S3431]
MNNTTSFTLIAPAKLNLFLHINGRREDGYHELETLFTFLNFGDELTFELIDTPDIFITGDTKGIPLTDNLIYKAALLLKTQSKTRLGVKINLIKRLPMGGGVGGGSSDAATTLLALNKLWKIDRSLDELARLGLQLGADVPVFVRGQSAIAHGIGEELHQVELEQKWYCVVHPNQHVSTATIFTHPDLKRDTPKILGDWKHHTLTNDCEPLVKKLCPEVEKTLQWLLKYAPSKMTGTGSCCFVEFASQVQAQDVLANLPHTWQGFIASSVNISPAHTELAAIFDQ